MPGGLRIGSMYVSLSANSLGLVKGLDSGLKAIDRFAKEVKKSAEDAAKVTATFSVLSAAALKMASSVDGPTKKALGELERSTQLLAVQVADMLLPAVRELAGMFRQAAQAVAALSPEAKAAAASLAVLAVQTVVAGKALSSLASGVSVAASLGRNLLSAATAGGSAVLALGQSVNVLGTTLWASNKAFVAATPAMKGFVGNMSGGSTLLFRFGMGLGSVAESLIGLPRAASAAAAGMMKSFKALPMTLAKGLTGIGPALLAGFKGLGALISGPVIGPLLSIILVVGAVAAGVALLHRAWRKNWGGIQDLTKSVLEWFRDGFSKLGTFLKGVFKYVTRAALQWVEKTISAVEVLSQALGFSFDANGWREGMRGLFKDLESGAVFDGAFKLGQTIGEAIGEGASEWQLIFKELGLDKLMSKVKGFVSGGSGKTIPTGRGQELPKGPITSGAAVGPGEAMLRSTVVMADFVKAVANDEAALEAHAKAIRENATEWLAEDAAHRRESAASFQKDLEARRQARQSAQQAANEAASNMRLLFARGSGDTSELTKAEKTTFKAQNEAVFSASVGESDWGKALSALKSGLSGAYSVGDALKLWGARMGPLVAQMGTQLLGEVGNLVNSIAQGAQAGGVWGAVLAAFMEIAKKTESAMRFLDDAMTFVGELAKMVEPLVKPIFEALTNVLGVVMEIVAPVFLALGPLFTAIGKLVDDLAPILYAVGDVLAAISPILEFIGRLVGMLFTALKPIFELIGGVIKVVATVILGIVIMLNELASAFGDEKARAEAARLRKMVSDMWARTAEDDKNAMKGAGDHLRTLTDESKNASDAVKEFAESLTNLPSGFKLLGARFAADTGMSGPTTITDPFEERATTIVVENLTVTASNPEEFARVLRKAGERTLAQRTGNRFGSDWRDL